MDTPWTAEAIYYKNITRSISKHIRNNEKFQGKQKHKWLRGTGKICGTGVSSMEFSDRNLKRGFLGKWFLGVIPGPLWAKVERRKSERTVLLEWQHMWEEYVKVRSRGLGWDLNSRLEKGVLNASLNDFDPGRKFQAGREWTLTELLASTNHAFIQQILI